MGCIRHAYRSPILPYLISLGIFSSILAVILFNWGAAHATNAATFSTPVPPASLRSLPTSATTNISATKIIEVEVKVPSNPALQHLQQMGYPCVEVGICRLELHEEDLAHLRAIHYEVLILAQAVKLAVAATAPQSTTEMSGANNNDISLMEGTEVDSSIQISGVPADATVKAIKYSLRVQHSQVNDVWLDLVLNADVSAPVWQRYGGTTDNGLDDDPADDQDIELFERWVDTEFDGQPVNGRWDLTAYDFNVNGQTGYIDYFYLWIYYEFAGSCADNSDSYTCTVVSTTGWQNTPLSLQQGDQFVVSYDYGAWTMDYRSLTYLGPDGYSPAEDSQFWQGCKADPTATYARVLGQIGNGSILSIGAGGTFIANADGVLALRMNDGDGCLADNDGAITLTIQKVIDLEVTTITAPVEPICGGATIDFSAFIHNNGTAASGSFYIRWDADGQLFSGGHNSIAAGATDTHGHRWENIPLGQHTLTFAADTDNFVTETDETNNQHSLTFTAVDCSTPPAVQFGATTYTVNENGQVGGFQDVRLSAASSQPVTVQFVTSNGTATANSDYTSQNVTLTFTPGETSKSFNVSILQDNLDENDETINLTLSNPTNATLGAPASASLTIVDDDPLPTVQFNNANYSINENGGSATIQVNLGAASGRTVTIDYATSNSTATAGSDYTAQSGALTFNPGVTVQTFAAPILDDAVDESDETVNLVLSNPTNATLGVLANATLTILDNDDSLPAIPTAKFTANPTAAVKPLTTNFTDQSTGSITTWFWNFGDGGTSTQQSPAHTYTNAGDYTVELTVSGPGGSNTKTQTNYIHVSEPIPPPVANFSASPLSGNKPLTVNFTDQSTGSITGWSWNFGDGGTSTQQSPAHTYNNAGDYNVLLTVSGSGGSNTKTTPNYIHVSEPLGLAVPTLNAIVNTEQDGHYVIAWQTVANATSYELQEQANNGNWTTIYTGSATSYNLTGKVASLWCYRLRSNSAGNNSDWSAPQCTTVATNAPSLTLPDKVLALPGSQVVLPITYAANGNNISAILFSINYDQTKLNFNPVDGNGDRVPDAIQFSGAIPAGFVKLVAFDASDTNGELDFTISDFAAAPRPVPGGIIASITLGVLAASPVKVEAPVNFAATSFGGASGDVPGVSDDGSVFVTDRLSLYLPLIRK